MKGFIRGIRRVRREAYRVGRVGGDVQAIAEALDGHPGAIPRRIARKAAWRGAGGLLGRVFR